MQIFGCVLLRRFTFIANNEFTMCILHFESKKKPNSKYRAHTYSVLAPYFQYMDTEHCTLHIAWTHDMLCCFWRMLHKNSNTESYIFLLCPSHLIWLSKQSVYCVLFFHYNYTDILAHHNITCENEAKTIQRKSITVSRCNFKIKTGKKKSKTRTRENLFGGKNSVCNANWIQYGQNRRVHHVYILNPILKLNHNFASSFVALVCVHVR